MTAGSITDMKATAMISAILLTLTGFVLMEEDELTNSIAGKVRNLRKGHALDLEDFRRYLDEEIQDENVNNKNDVETLKRKLNQALNSRKWNHFTPSPVDQPECHIELTEVRKVPGRCVKFGEGVPSCQSQDHLQLNFKECS